MAEPPAPEPAPAPAEEKSSETSLVSMKLRTQIPKYWNPTLPKETRRGLPNEDFMCYRNVIFQTLVHSPIFYNWLGWYKNQHAPDGYVCTLGSTPKKGPSVCKLCYMYNFFERYWEDTDRAVPHFTKIAKAIKDSWKPGPDNREEDPAEYLDAVFTQLRKEIKPLFQKDFDDIFQMRVVEVRRCIGDKACKPEYYPRNQSILPLAFPETITESESSGGPPKQSVSDALEQHLAHTDDNGKCEACHGQKVSQEQIGSLPEILFIQLNRLDETGKKITDHIHFSDPLMIETQFIDERHGDDRESVQYKLYAVIMHIGEDMMGGHYKVGVKGSSDEWIMANDKTVEGWSAETFLNDSSHLADAYIFAYRRLPTDEVIENLTKDKGEVKPQPKKHRTIGTPFPNLQLNKEAADSVAKLLGEMIPNILDTYIARSEETRHKEWEKWTNEWTEKIQEAIPEMKGTKRSHDEQKKGEGDGEGKNEYDWNKTRGRLEIILTEDQGKGEKVLDLEVQGMHFNRLKGQVRKQAKGTEAETDDETAKGKLGRLGRKVKDKLRGKRQKTE